MYRYILVFFLSAFLLQPSVAQKKDSITVSVEAIQNLQAEFNELSKTVTIQDSIIAEQAEQIQLWRERARQDSTLLALSDKRMKITKARFKIRKDRIKELEKKNLWLRIRSYVWTVGGIVIGFLAGGV